MAGAGKCCLPGRADGQAPITVPDQRITQAAIQSLIQKQVKMHVPSTVQEKMERYLPARLLHLPLSFSSQSFASLF
jgi:hypothetical protein